MQTNEGKRRRQATRSTKKQGAQKGQRVSERRPWPNSAMDARDRSSEEAAAIDALLTPILDPDAGAHMSEADRLRRIGLAIRKAQQIMRFLEKQGAQTRPL